jgi:oligoribonuclease
VEVRHYRGSPLLHSTLLQSAVPKPPDRDVVFFMSSDKNLIWIDLEMTGLDTDNDHIIEIATIVTDSDLNVLGEGPVFAVFQPDSVLAKMDEWNTRQHGQSGLTERVRNSKTDMRAAELATIEFLRQHVPAGKSPMCGNSICQDRRFLAREMPELERFFHYRNLDVSTLKELVKRWRPDIAAGLSKSSTHLALDDIRESIAELKYYRDTFLKLS